MKCHFVHMLRYYKTTSYTTSIKLLAILYVVVMGTPTLLCLSMVGYMKRWVKLKALNLNPMEL